MFSFTGEHGNDWNDSEPVIVKLTYLQTLTIESTSVYPGNMWKFTIMHLPIRSRWVNKCMLTKICNKYWHILIRNVVQLNTTVMFGEKILWSFGFVSQCCPYEEFQCLTLHFTVNTHVQLVTLHSLQHNIFVFSYKIRQWVKRLTQIAKYLGNIMPRAVSAGVTVMHATTSAEITCSCNI